LSFFLAATGDVTAASTTAVPMRNFVNRISLLRA
jgi:hypothetical protein